MSNAQVKVDATTKPAKAEKVAKLKTNKNGPSAWSNFLQALQNLGKALQFPVAMLPFAAILNRFGQLGIDLSNETGSQVGHWISFIIQQPGAAAFNNLALFFAIGTAFGMAKENRGEVALVGALFYFILTAMTAENTLPEMIYGGITDSHLSFTATAQHSHGLLDATKGKGTSLFSKLFYVPIYGANGETIDNGKYVLDIGVLGGITAGCLSAFLYNKFKDIKLPTALSFFGGRRFVPMMAMLMAVPVAFIFAIVWPWIQWGLIEFGNAVAHPDKPEFAIPGSMIYALLNRLLLPFGLHQILNTLFWFQLPFDATNVVTSWTGNLVHDSAAGYVNGDIAAFAGGVKGSGLFQSGYFPIMMGGIPAIAVAMIFTAKKENRKEVAGFLGGVAGVSFLSGITEPVEFSFVFISPVLLGVHAGLSAIFMGIATAMRIEVGFGFSAGFIDYAASFAQSWGFSVEQGGIWSFLSNPLMLLALVVAAFPVWFFIFTILIKKLDIKTPGREDMVTGSVQAAAPSAKSDGKVSKADKYTTMAEKVIAAVGADNFDQVDNCATRLRLTVKDSSIIDDAAIKAAGTFGIKRLGETAVQIVVGADVEHVSSAMKKILGK